MGILPEQFYDLEFGDYLLMRRGYIDKVKVESQLLRFQTALICEAFVGKGQGVRYVMGAWNLDDEEATTEVDVKELLKGKLERDTMIKLKEKKRQQVEHLKKGTK